MIKKNTLLYAIIALVTTITFLWNQCVWAIGFETLHSHPPDNLPQNFVTKNLIFEADLPQNLHETSPKVFSRFLAIPTEKADFEAKFAYTGAENPIQTCVTPSGNDRLGRIDEKYGTYDGKKYKWEAISYDELGRPTAYKEKYGKVSSKHYDILYNELGDVAYEKIKVTAKSGGLIKSKTTVVTEYWYGYDEYGQHEKIKENEIYRKVTKSFIGKVLDVIDAVLKIASIFIPILKPFSFVFSLVNQVLQTGDIKGVLLQLAAQAIGAALGGMLTAEGAAGGLADFFGQFDLTGAFNAGTSSYGIGAVFKVFNIIDDLVGDLTGESITQRMFGENAGIVRAIFGVLGNLLSPDGMNAYNLIAGLGSIGLEILKRNNPEFAQSDLGKFLFAMVDQALNTWATIETREAKAKELQKEKGADGITRDKYNRPTGVYKDTSISETAFIRDYYNLEGEYQGYEEYSLYDESIGDLNIDGSFGGITISDKDGNKLYESESKFGLDFDSFGKGFDSRLDDLSLYPNDTGDIIAIGIQEGDKITVIGLTGKLGTMPVNATPIFNSEGKLLYSEIDTDYGTISFDLEGNLAGFIPNGFTPVRLEDTIAYSYLPVSENSFLMVDSNGGNLKLVTQKLDNMGIPIGEFITDATTISYYDSRGIKLWDRANQVNSTINLYLEDGSVWGEITTLVTKSNLVSGYLFDNKLSGETSLYDWAGTLDSMIDAKGDFYQYNEKGEVVLYVPEGFDIRRSEQTQQVIDVIGYDDKGNFISQDPKGRINYKVTAEGDTQFFDIDGRLSAIMYAWDLDANNLKTFTYFDQFDDMGNLIGSTRLRSDGLATILDKDGNEFYSFNLAEIQQDIILKSKQKAEDLTNAFVQKTTEFLKDHRIMPKEMPVSRDKMVGSTIPIGFYKYGARKEIRSDFMTKGVKYENVATSKVGKYITSITPSYFIVYAKDFNDILMDINTSLIFSAIGVPFVKAGYDLYQGDKSGAGETVLWDGAILAIKYTIGKTAQAIREFRGGFESFNNYRKIAWATGRLANQINDLKQVVDSADEVTGKVELFYNSMLKGLQASDMYGGGFKMPEVLVRGMLHYFNEQIVNTSIPDSTTSGTNKKSFASVIVDIDKYGRYEIKGIRVPLQEFGEYDNYQSLSGFINVEKYYGAPNMTKFEMHDFIIDMAYAYKMIVEYDVPWQDVKYGNYIMKGIIDSINRINVYKYDYDNWDWKELYKKDNDVK